MLAVMVVMMVSCGAQDVSDCSWLPHQDSAQLKCNLKTLQTGPAVIPEVRKEIKPI